MFGKEYQMSVLIKKPDKLTLIFSCEECLKDEELIVDAKNYSKNKPTPEGWSKDKFCGVCAKLRKYTNHKLLLEYGHSWNNTEYYETMSTERLKKEVLRRMKQRKEKGELK